MEKLGYKIGELAQNGPIGRTKLYEAIHDGKLRARKNGKSTIILLDDYKTFLANLPSARSIDSTAAPRRKAAEVD